MTTAPIPTAELERIIELGKRATKGPWHHCQPFQKLPKTRTVHGLVPAQRVDYVSTWPGQGTPDGHRTVIPMERREVTASSDDMAFIAAARRADALAAELIAAREALNTAWMRINALGGRCGEYDDYGHGINHAVEQALLVIDELGGRDPSISVPLPSAAQETE